jgi:GNAT superfamily N-acetyltransferase
MAAADAPSVAVAEFFAMPRAERSSCARAASPSGTVAGGTPGPTPADAAAGAMIATTASAQTALDTLRGLVIPKDSASRPRTLPGVTDSPPVGRVATIDDVPAVAACLADAFHEDPVWGHWTFPDSDRRAALLAKFMEFWAICGARTPWLWTSGDSETVTVWVPPGEPDMTPAEAAILEALLPELLGNRAPEVASLFDQFDDQHPHDEPHYYLGWWATHRDHAGRGLGTALIRENLALIDAEHMPAYLESTNPANIPRYEALGFRPRSEFGPPGGPVITTMWRDAR